MNAINSLSDYLSKINAIRGFPAKSLFFRGHASEKWDLKPSLFRENSTIHEWDMYNQATTYFPQVFIGCKNNLERIVTMQHYGLETRLLDVTSNPLVALYFACQDCEDADYGQVFYIEKNPEQLTNAEVISDLLFLILNNNSDTFDKETINVF